MPQKIFPLLKEILTELVGIRSELSYPILAIQKTAISAAYSINFHRAITGSYPELGVDYSKIMISKGNLPVLSNLAARLIAPSVMELTWQNDIYQNLSA